MTSGRLRCLCGISNCGDLAPGAEDGGAGGTVLVGGEAMAAEPEVIVDADVGEQELLGVARALEPLHLPSSSYDHAAVPPSPAAFRCYTRIRLPGCVLDACVACHALQRRQCQMAANPRRTAVL